MVFTTIITTWGVLITLLGIGFHFLSKKFPSHVVIQWGLITTEIGLIFEMMQLDTILYGGMALLLGGYLIYTGILHPPG